MNETRREYRGNKNLKPVGVELEFTGEQILEIQKCAEDHVYFIKKYVKIVNVDRGLIPFDLWDFQEEMTRKAIDNRFFIAKMPRQVGKCFSINTIVKIKNKATGLVEEIAIGELYERIKSLYAECGSQSQEIDCTLSREIQKLYRRRGLCDMSSMRLQSIRTNIACYSYSWYEGQRSYTFDVQQNSSGSIGKNERAQESVVPTRWDNVAFFEELYQRRYGGSDCRESKEYSKRKWDGIDNSSLLVKEDRWGRGSRKSSFKQKTKNVQFRNLHREAWTNRGAENLGQSPGKVGQELQKTELFSNIPKTILRDNADLQLRSRLFCRMGKCWDGRLQEQRIQIKAKWGKNNLTRFHRSEYEENNRIRWDLLAQSSKGQSSKRKSQRKFDDQRRLFSSKNQGRGLQIQSGENAERVFNLSDSVVRKFVESYNLNEYEVWTDSGWQNVSALHKTVEYSRWIIKTKSHYLECADDHIVFTHDMKEIFVKDLKIGDKIHTESGIDEVIECYDSGLLEHMFDLTVDSIDHRFYTNGILSHNTQTIAALLLWYILFNEEFSIAILANKERQAREILARIKNAYEYLPIWLQQGVVEWNKSTIELENGSKILASSTSSSAIRGTAQNCISGDSMITICDDYGRIYHIPISEANSSKYKYNESYNHYREFYMYYTVYKIINNINQKEYIGYHQTNNLDDGYMGSGKLIKAAIQKYGIDSFTKEYIAICDTREEAEALEAILVDAEYTLREDTYNISLGGNLLIMHGRNNPMFGVTLPRETIERIRQKNLGRNNKEEDDIIIDGVKYNSWSQAYSKLDCTTAELYALMVKPGNGFIDLERQQKLLDYLSELNERKEQNKVAVSIRTGALMRSIKRTDTWKSNISKSHTGKKKTEDHVNKINRNPEKIRKTAEKHTGMKRSNESKQRMSDAAKGRKATNSGKWHIYNPETGEVALIVPGEIPSGWIRGMRPRKPKS